MFKSKTRLCKGKKNLPTDIAFPFHVFAGFLISVSFLPYKQACFALSHLRQA